MVPFRLSNDIGYLTPQRIYNTPYEVTFTITSLGTVNSNCVDSQSNGDTNYSVRTPPNHAFKITHYRIFIDSDYTSNNPAKDYIQIQVYESGFLTIVSSSTEMSTSNGTHTLSGAVSTERTIAADTQYSLYGLCTPSGISSPEIKVTLFGMLVA